MTLTSLDISSFSQVYHDLSIILFLGSKQKTCQLNIRVEAKQKSIDYVVSMFFTSLRLYCVMSVTLRHDVGHLGYVVTLLDTVPPC